VQVPKKKLPPKKMSERTIKEGPQQKERKPVRYDKKKQGVVKTSTQKRGDYYKGGGGEGQVNLEEKISTCGGENSRQGWGSQLL